MRILLFEANKPDKNYKMYSEQCLKDLAETDSSLIYENGKLYQYVDPEYINNETNKAEE